MNRENVSVRLKKIITERGLKQSDILKKCAPICEKFNNDFNKNLKITKSDLSQWISGKYEPGHWKSTILAEALGINPAWLMGFDVPMEMKQTDPLHNEYDEQIEKTAIDLGGKILYIEKDRELTSDDVLNITKQLTEIVEKQKKEKEKKDK